MRKLGPYLRQILVGIIALALSNPAFAVPAGTAQSSLQSLNLFPQRTLHFAFAGDSTAETATGYVPVNGANGSIYLGYNSFASWLQSFSDDTLVAYPDTTSSWPVSTTYGLTVPPQYGFVGPAAGIHALHILTGGSCTPAAGNSITFNVVPVSGGSGAGTVSVQFSSGSALFPQAIAEATPGSGYLNGVTLSVADGSTCSQLPTVGISSTGFIGFGVPGDGSAGLLQRVPEICLQHPDLLIISTITNDINAGMAFSAISGNITAINAALEACGIRPAWKAVAPRANWGTASTAEPLRLRVNKLLQAISRVPYATNPALTPISIESDRYLVNAADANGKPVQGATFDALHPATLDAWIEALDIWTALKPLSPAGTNRYGGDDQLDAFGTNNPGGNLLGLVGIMQGTGGSAGPCSGAPLGWTFAWSGTTPSAGNCTLSSISGTSRSDGQQGTQLVITLSGITSTAAQATLTMAYYGVTSNFSTGDNIRLSAQADVSGNTNFGSPGIYLSDQGATYIQQASDSYSGNAWTTTYGAGAPDASQVAKIWEARNLPDFGLTGSGSYRRPLLAPAMPVQSGANHESPTINLICNTVNSQTCSAVIKIWTCRNARSPINLETTRRKAGSERANAPSREIRASHILTNGSRFPSVDPFRRRARDRNIIGTLVPMESSQFRAVKPVSPYFGGKRLLAKRLISRIDAIPHELYGEAFVGMGGVFLRRSTPAKVEVINDLSKDVSTLFRILQRHYQQFLDVIKWQLTTRIEFERLVKVNPDTLTDLERAARFLYLQRTAFGGKVVGRHFGISRTGPARFDLTKLVPMLEEVHTRLTGVVIESLPYGDFLRRYDRDGALFYLDPPYWDCESDYGPIFDREDFTRLADLLKGLKARFIMSLNDTEGVRQTFGAFAIESVETTYSVSGSPTKAREVIISN